MEYIASTLEGLESITEEELSGKKIFPGRVLYTKPKKIIRSALFSYKLLKQFKFKKEEDIYKIDFNQKIKGSFRVDCNREGKHKFNSQDIRRSFGEKLFNQGFKVDLKKPDNIIFMDIKNDNCFIGINPVQNSKRGYRIRNTSGSINSTIAYSLVSLAEINKTDNVLDPFCKDGVILIEAGISKAKKLNGLERDIKNSSINSKLAKIKINLSNDPLDWIETRFKEGSITKIVTNLPSASKNLSKNAALEIIKEFFYQSKHALNKKGLIVLLTRDQDTVKKIAAEFEFKVIDSLKFNQGDTNFTILKLKRS